MQTYWTGPRTLWFLCECEQFLIGKHRNAGFMEHSVSELAALAIFRSSERCMSSFQFCLLQVK